MLWTLKHVFTSVGCKNFGKSLVSYVKYGLHSDLKREFATIFFYLIGTFDCVTAKK